MKERVRQGTAITFATLHSQPTLGASSVGNLMAP